VFPLAYNLGNLLRTLALPRKIDHWTLTTLREKLITIGAKVVRHARYITFQMAEVPIPSNLFAAILSKIDRQWNPRSKCLSMTPTTGIILNESDK
jgi:hypothetical protein